VASRADQILIELAIKNHLITEVEGQECLQAADQSGSGVGQVLLGKNYVKERHLQSLQKKLGQILEDEGSRTVPDSSEDARAGAANQATFVAPSPPPPAMAPGAIDETFVAPDPESAEVLQLSADSGIVLFGQIAVKQGYVNQASLDRALHLQEENPVAKGMRIGEILIRAKQMTPAQVNQVLDYQGKWIVACNFCQKRFNLSGSQDLGGGLRCLACGAGSLVKAGESSVSVDATHGAPAGGLSPMQAGAGGLARGSTRREPTSDDPAGLLGLEWKGYRVDRILGKGGMGAVYKAVQLSLRRDVALKVMLRGSAQASGEERKRFEREAKLIGNLIHPNIVKVFEAQWDDDLCWFTMEMVPGEDFKAKLRSGKFPMRDGAAVVAKVARAMDFAHRKGVIHRDLKPQNVMIDEESGEPKILDFGLAKNLDQQTVQQLTQMGAFLGTPAYMAPEQAGGDPNAIDARADIYALGAILYEVLTGRPPFTGKKAIQVIRKVLKEDPVHPRKVFEHADPMLSEVALKALAKDPEERHETAGALADEIEKKIGRVSRVFTRVVDEDQGPSGTKQPEQTKRKQGFFGRLFGSD